MCLEEGRERKRERQRDRDTEIQRETGRHRQTEKLLNYLVFVNLISLGRKPTQLAWLFTAKVHITRLAEAEQKMSKSKEME